MPQPNQFQPFLINCSDLVNQVLDIRLIVFKICDFKNRIRTENVEPEEEDPDDSDLENLSFDDDYLGEE